MTRRVKIIGLILAIVCILFAGTFVSVFRATEFGGTFSHFPKHHRIPPRRYEPWNPNNDMFASPTPVFQQVSAVAKTLPEGKLRVTAPSTFTVGHPGEISLAIADHDKAFADLQTRRGDRIIQVRTGNSVFVAPYMRAYIRSTSLFKVEPLIDDIARVYVPGQEIEWEWLVTPLRSGTNDLIIVIEAVMPDGRFDRVKEVPVAVQAAPLTERVGQFAATNWYLLFTAFIAPLAVALWRVVRSR